VQLVVAEKPSVARDLARILGVAPRGEHCFEGERHVVTWCIGHLVELDEPASYDPRWRAWRLENLPMLPEEFRLRASKHAHAQLRAVSTLLRDRRRFQSVINACDAGREGELIFRYVYQYARSTLSVQRLWVSSLTDEALRRGFASLRPGTQLEPLADAARSRSEADWLVGMNATRAITSRGREAGHDALYSIGRVQTPTLAMLVVREHQIRAFIPRPYWEVRGDFTTAPTAQAAGGRFSAGWRANTTDARLGAESLATTLVARDRAAVATSPAIVERTRARTVREAAPLLFDLTSLQRTANRRFGFSAARTLEVAQALYERHKVLTYPRTDSRHLSTDVVGELPNLFASLATIAEYAPFAQPLVTNPPRAPSRRIVDDTKVGDHHAIIPTSRPARPASLDRDEARIYDLVVRRFLGVFYPDAEFAITEAWIKVGSGDSAVPKFPDETPRHATSGASGASGASGTSGTSGSSGGSGTPPSTRALGTAPNAATNAGPAAEPREPTVLDALPPPPDRYFARGRVRTVAGWQEVAGIGADASSNDDSLATLPPLREGDRLASATFTSIAKQTTPPPRYTEATLLGAMESAGKSIDDEALRAAMKDRGLGTPATRANIIETLLRRTYIIRERQHLTPTAMGIALIDALPVASLASPELTGSWEARLAQIARGEDSRARFMADIARYVADMVDAIRGAPAPAGPPPGSAPSQPQQRSSWGSGRDGRGSRGGRGNGGRNEVRRNDATAGRGDRSNARGSRSGGGGAGDTVNANRGPSSEPAGRSSNSRSKLPSLARSSRSSNRRSNGRSNGQAVGQANGSSNDPSTHDASTRATQHATAKRLETPKVDELAALGCPGCRLSNLIAGSRGWGCARWREGCRFVIWFETAGRRITAAQLRDLVTRGKTRKATFEPVRGVPQAGRLVLDTSPTTLASPSGAARFEPIAS
jgi:DNA topoisomerase-3